MISPRPPIALTVAGSDSSGGAGIQADLKTFSALGVYGASVITALTAQNTGGVRAIHDPPVPFILAQLDAVLEDLEVAAVKLGMLSRAEVVRAVAVRLRGAPNLVLDPVMVAKGGAPLLAPAAVDALRAELFPLCAVVTPNLPEAAVLLGEAEAQVRADMEGACRRLHRLGARAVVLKGGHALDPAESVDLLYDGATLTRLVAPRVATRNTHGTGCTFAAAIAALLARGQPLPEAAAGAKRYVSAAIAAAGQLSVGRGQGGAHGPVHHFHAWW